MDEAATFASRWPGPRQSVVEEHLKSIGLPKEDRAFLLASGWPSGEFGKYHLLPIVSFQRLPAYAAEHKHPRLAGATWKSYTVAGHCLDQIVCLEEGTGYVVMAGPDAGTLLLSNHSVHQFLSCVLAVELAFRAARIAHGDDLDDEVIRSLEQPLRRELRRIDPEAASKTVADGGWWDALLDSLFDYYR
jgi:hypothetical protein